MACHTLGFALFLIGALLVPHIAALGGCNQACGSNDDCSGQLACINGNCNDDPDVGTNICGGTGGGSPPSCPSQGGSDTCQPSGCITSPTITPDMCNDQEMSECCVSGRNYATYTCSPPITQPTTKATLTLNGFGDGESGGGKASCTDRYYSSDDAVVALSTGWFANRARCGKTIRITGNGRTTTAMVVDECDTRAGCDEEHAYQPPCPLIDDVDASPAVWAALGVSPSDDRYGMMSITWSQID